MLGDMQKLKRRLARFLGSSTPVSPVPPVPPVSPGTASEAEPAAGGVSGDAYAPEVDGEPDPGEVVWTWVAYEDDPSQGKDRPVLVLRAEGEGWVGLYLSSQDHDRDAADEARHGRYWMDVGTGDWDSQGRPSEVRLDRPIILGREAVRREGAALDAALFAEVVAAAGRHGGP